MDENLILTFDVDWAPDWCIQQIIGILIENKIKTTWFVTHDSPAIEELRGHSDLFELGIHPNFQDGSTQGNSPHEIMEQLLNIVPNARSVRTHGLLQSSRLIKMMTEEFDVEFDVSLFLPYVSDISPHILHTSKKSSIVRIPYFWEDDLEMLFPETKLHFNDLKYNIPGLKIFNFHPIHIGLNSASLDLYEECKNRVVRISNLTKHQAEPFINHERGMLTCFMELIHYLKSKDQKSAMISEIGDDYRCRYEERL